MSEKRKFVPPKFLIWAVAVLAVLLIVISIIATIQQSDMKYAYHIGQSGYYFENPEYHALGRIAGRCVLAGVPMLLFGVPGLLVWRNFEKIKKELWL